jgi:hypothetical protein
MDFVEQASAASGQDYKFQTNIEILDGGNGTGLIVLETWELYGCFIQTANYNTLNYATNEAVTIALTLRYDNAIQSAGGTLVGVGWSFEQQEILLLVLVVVFNNYIGY